MIKKLLILLFLTPSVVFGQSKGLDLLGLAKLDTKMIAPLLPNNTCMGTLSGTFGNIAPHATDLLSTNKVSCWRDHLLNGPCARSHNCESGEPGLRDFGAIEKRARAVVDTLKNFPSVACYLSPVLEYDERDKTVVQKWIDAIKRGAGDRCKIVLSPASGVVLPGYLVERHGNSYGKADVRSNDGESLFEAPSTYPSEGSSITFGWIPSFNLRRQGESAFTPPSRRSSVLSKAELVQAIGIMFGAAQPAPEPVLVGCKNTLNPRDGTDNFVWKLADRGKAVFLAPAKFQSVFKKVEILSNGKVFDTFKYRHPFTEHGRPYRMIYDGNHTLDKYPFNSVLRGDSTCWILDNPHGRID